MFSTKKNPTELLFGDDLAKHVKDLNESYNQSKYSDNKYSKDYAKTYTRQFFLGRERGNPACLRFYHLKWMVLNPL